MTERRKISTPSTLPISLVGSGKPTSRSREWDRRARHTQGFCVVTYRFIPLELRDTIRQIAEDHAVTVDDIARLLLEYALGAYENDEISINPTLQKGRLSIFPRNGKPP